MEEIGNLLKDKSSSSGIRREGIFHKTLLELKKKSKIPQQERQKLQSHTQPFRENEKNAYSELSF